MKSVRNPANLNPRSSLAKGYSLEVTLRDAALTALAAVMKSLTAMFVGFFAIRPKDRM